MSADLPPSIEPTGSFPLPSCSSLDELKAQLQENRTRTMALAARLADLEARPPHPAALAANEPVFSAGRLSSDAILEAVATVLRQSLPAALTHPTYQYSPSSPTYEPEPTINASDLVQQSQLLEMMAQRAASSTPAHPTYSPYSPTYVLDAPDSVCGSSSSAAADATTAPAAEDGAASDVTVPLSDSENEIRDDNEDADTHAVSAKKARVTPRARSRKRMPKETRDSLASRKRKAHGRT